jgi:hypothetical protein
MLAPGPLKVCLKRAALALALVCAALPACSSDAAPEPEPTLETPGAFVAVNEEDEEDDAADGALTLMRILDTLSLPNDTVLFVTVYNVNPTSWDEAREIAKSHDIPIRLDIQFASRAPLVAHPYRVVWFRTLTDEEKDRIP